MRRTWARTPWPPPAPPAPPGLLARPRLSCRLACSLARVAHGRRLAGAHRSSPAPACALPKLALAWPQLPAPLGPSSPAPMAPLGRSSPELARACPRTAEARPRPRLAAAPGPAWSELARAHGPAWLELGRALPWRAGAHPRPAGARAQDLCASDEPHDSMSARRGHLRPAGHRDGGSADGRGRRPAACGAEVAGDSTQWRAGGGAREGGGRSRGGRGHNRGQQRPE
jgi:hypothetical protein